MKKLYLINLLLFFLAISIMGQEWVVYDCSVLPDASTFAFSESNVAGDPASNTILDDPHNTGNKFLELISPGADPGKFMWKYSFPNDVNDSVTIIMRIKGTSDTLDRTMELDLQQAGFRERLYIKNNMEYEMKEIGEKIDLSANPLDWHIIRLTKEADTVTLFIDENPVPVTAGRTGTSSGENYFRFGDGNGSSTLGALVDWIAWDTTGAYAPGAGAAIPDSLVVDVPTWIVYPANVTPDLSPLGFSESNVAGDPATNTILADAENVGNNILELISPGADPGKFMWKHNFEDNENDPFTLVARVKKVSDTLDRTMEFDIQQAGFRERLFIRNNGEYELKQAGVREDLPIGVLGWHIYRINKDADTVNFYVDENPVPVASVVTSSTTSDNYWRFGDGNGSSTLGGLVDWIIWDTTGAYAPGQGELIPDSLVTDVSSSDATLSDLGASIGTLEPAFSPEVTNYTLTVDRLATSVTLTATAADANASASGDGEITDFPGEVTITVTAEDGFKMEYTVTIDVTIPDWVVYAADSLPENDNIDFETSNVDGDPATNTILADPDNMGNNLLELISPGADAKFMWKHNLPNDVNDAFTLVARVKKVSDTLDRTMEFDIQQAGFRERLFLRNNGEFELKEGGIREDLPVGVLGWHIFRLNKDGDTVNFYVDENPEPVASIVTETTTDENYMRFGDGNGSSTLGGLIDWVIWDTTGAFAPGTQSLIPDSLIQDISASNAMLTELTSSEGVLVPTFSPEVTDYELTVAPGTESVTLTATPADANATVSGDGEITEIPGTATVVVSAEDGYKMEYAVMVKISSPDWVVYTADILPDNDSIDFETSNVDGDPATNTIVADPDNMGNNMLELISPGADAKFMWKHNLPNDVDDAFTLVARVKKVSDTYDRTMEFDIQQAGFRERIYLRNNGEFEIKEAGVREDLPIGVLGWHIFRINKDGDSVNFYIDENPEPIASTITETTSDENYFRFGDGNGSSTLGGLIDWIIWDTTGAYAPGILSLIPDSLVSDITPSDATLSGIAVTTGTLTPAFDAGTMEYDLDLDVGTTSVTVTATATDPLAVVTGDGDVTSFPDTIYIEVVAQDGLTMEYQVNIIRDNTGINDIRKDLVRIFPNPADEVINIQYLGSETAEFMLYDMMGKLILNQEITQDITSINVSDLTGGLYILRINSGDFSENHKIVIR